MRPKLFFFITLTLLLGFYSFAENYVDEDRFFSYKRFFLNPKAIDRIPDSGRAQEDLSIFVARFTDGLYAISAGNLKKAEKDLLKAREVWPEYFATDFVLALVYEDAGNYKRAARYYKSYLIKLKKLQAGEYPMSEPLIRNFTEYRIEPYELAHQGFRHGV